MRFDTADEIADLWERAKIVEWNQRYAKHEQLNPRFFKPDDDKELIDTDGPNTDGGTDLPPMWWSGDGLTVSQEYRGFILDGGQAGGATPGHSRLSPVDKDLLIEADMMAGVQGMPDASSTMKSILNQISDGFWDKVDGAGIALYWVLDETSAGPHEHIATITRSFDWAQAHRIEERLLGDFVHLMLMDTATYTTAMGNAQGFGACVYVGRLAQIAQVPEHIPGDIVTTAAHEITHSLLHAIGQGPFNMTEHIINPDRSDPPDSPNDADYLMIEGVNLDGSGRILFDDGTRRYLDLHLKESVNRSTP